MTFNSLSLTELGQQTSKVLSINDNGFKTAQCSLYFARLLQISSMLDLELWLLRAENSVKLPAQKLFFPH